MRVGSGLTCVCVGEEIEKAVMQVASSVCVGLGGGLTCVCVCACVRVCVTYVCDGEEDKKRRLPTVVSKRQRLPFSSFLK
jgi:hypothetical protein